MLNNDIQSYVNYFADIAQKHKLIKSFCHGTVTRLISLTRSEIEYPALWLETPTTKVNENDAGEVIAGRYGAFVIISNAPETTPAEQDQIWQLTEEITWDIIARMKRDRKMRRFHGKLNLSIDPIETMLVDNDFGWRTEISLDKSVDLCYKSEKWEEGS